MNGPADFSAPGWLPGGHLQTLWPLLRKGSPPHYQRERWATPDGDFIDLDWLRAPETAPLLVLFHGLEGSSRSHYAISIMRETAARAAISARVTRVPSARMRRASCSTDTPRRRACSPSTPK